MNKVPGLFPIIVGAPLGNYIQSPGCTSTLGTYTLKDRAGFMRWRLAWRILRTLRWRPGLGGWTNKLGLPNPGIEALVSSRKGRAKHPAEGKIVSLHGFDNNEWLSVIYSACHGMTPPAAIELNISCPNVGHISLPPELFKNALATADEFGPAVPVIVKLPPVSYWPIYQMAYDQGIRNFHCCNTLPSPSGGLSGKVLQRVSLDVIARIKDKTPEVVIIGGGGITGPDDIERYWTAGARHFAVASALLRPKFWMPILGPLLADSFLTRLRARVDEYEMASLGIKPPESTIRASR